MKYKVGDRVKIRTWDSMEKEFGLRAGSWIECHLGFTLRMEQEVEEKHSNRVLTIEMLNTDYYRCCGMAWQWHDDMIEDTEEECRKASLVHNETTDRFSLMDFE